LLQKLRGAWGNWRESRRQYKIDRALYKAGGGRDASMPASDAVDKGFKSGLPSAGPGGI
jgi:hypothetical protein